MSPLQLLPLLPAIIASGRAVNTLGDIADAAPTLAPVLSGAETWGQLIDDLPNLHQSGKFKLIGDDIHDLWMTMDIELGDPAHMKDVQASLKSFVGAK